MVYFISGPKYSGKTTRMRSIISTLNETAGFITEKVFIGEEVSGYDIRDIRTGFVVPLARRKELDQPDGWGKDTIRGAFRFSLDAFRVAEKIVDRAIEEDAPAIFIDELGKLEIRGEGHYNAIKKALISRANLYLTIRDINIVAALKAFDIKEFETILVTHSS